MSVKIKYDNLYVAFPVYDYEVETEMFVQYETFGKVEHRLIISPKKRLIYSKIDADGVERFYDYMTSEEVKEFRFAKGKVCPHCNSELISRNGK